MARTLQFTVDSLIEQLPADNVGLTLRLVRKDHHTYGKPGDRGYIREPVRLVKAKRFSYEVEYRDGDKRRITGTPADSLKFTRWSLARFMPKACARVEYEVERVERRKVLSITEDEAKRAGFSDRMEYLQAWDELHAEKGNSSLTDPEAWFVFFKVTKVRESEREA